MRKSAVLFCAGLLSLFSFTAVAEILPSGIYVGSGDGAMTVLKVFPDGKALLGETNTYQGLAAGPDGKEVPQFYGGTTLKDYLEAVEPTNGPIRGTIRQRQKGVYELELNGSGLKPCYHKITLSQKGLDFSSGTPEKVCVLYHGASWSFTAGQHTLLKKVK